MGSMGARRVLRVSFSSPHGDETVDEAQAWRHGLGAMATRSHVNTQKERPNV